MYIYVHIYILGIPTLSWSFPGVCDSRKKPEKQPPFSFLSPQRLSEVAGKVVQNRKRHISSILGVQKMTLFFVTSENGAKGEFTNFEYA